MRVDWARELEIVTALEATGVPVEVVVLGHRTLNGLDLDSIAYEKVLHQ